MSSLNTSLNYLLASQFSDVGGARAAAPQVRQDPIAAQIRSGFRNLAPGSSISANYQYTVGNAGQLIPTGLTVSADKQVARVQDPLEQERNRQREDYYRQPDQRKQSFADLLNPRLTLSPADELALYAEKSIDEESQVVQLAAEDEQGDAVEATIVTPVGEEIGARVVDLAQRAQRAVAGLYAHNNDIVHNAQPAIQFAA